MSETDPSNPDLEAIAESTKSTPEGQKLSPSLTRDLVDLVRTNRKEAALALGGLSLAAVLAVLVPEVRGAIIGTSTGIMATAGIANLAWRRHRLQNEREHLEGVRSDYMEVIIHAVDDKVLRSENIDGGTITSLLYKDPVAADMLRQHVASCVETGEYPKSSLVKLPDDCRKRIERALSVAVKGLIAPSDYAIDVAHGNKAKEEIYYCALFMEDHPDTQTGVDLAIAPHDLLFTKKIGGGHLGDTFRLSDPAPPAHLRGTTLEKMREDVDAEGEPKYCFEVKLKGYR